MLVKSQDQLTQYNHYIWLIVCLSTQDLVAASRALQSYEQMDGNWAHSAENILLHQILEAIGQGDPEVYVQAMKAYNPRQHAMKEWDYKMLERIKRQIEEKTEDLS